MDRLAKKERIAKFLFAFRHVDRVIKKEDGTTARIPSSKTQEIVAKAIGSIRYLCKHTTDNILLLLFGIDWLIKLHKPWFTMIVHNYYPLDHTYLCCCKPTNSPRYLCTFLVATKMTTMTRMLLILMTRRVLLSNLSIHM